MYLYCHNFGCVFSKSVVGSCICELWNHGIEVASLSSEDIDEHSLLKEAYAFLFGSPEAFLQNKKWINFFRSNV